MKYLNKNVQIETVAVLKLDSAWNILIDKRTLTQNKKIDYDTLNKYSAISIKNDTLIIDLKILQDSKYSLANNVESHFKNELFNSQGLCYNCVDNYYENKLIYESFNYYYGPRAAGAGWHYRLKGTKIIIKSRFKWIS